MKLLVVLSQVNYMPENYNGLLSGLISASKADESLKIQVVACASLKTLDSSLIKSILKLPLVGVFNLPKQIIKNILSYFLRERQKICQEQEIEHLEWESMNSKAAINWVIENEIDLILNLRTRCIYKKEILKAPKLGCVNIHHGILPKYRGTFCDLYALYESREAGFTIHKMAQKVDAGEIYKTHVVDDGREKNYSKYLEKTVNKEITYLFEFLQSCADSKKFKLPQGQVNSINKPIYTKNPDAKMIKKFKNEGMTL